MVAATKGGHLNRRLRARLEGIYEGSDEGVHLNGVIDGHDTPGEIFRARSCFQIIEPADDKMTRLG